MGWMNMEINDAEKREEVSLSESNVLLESFFEWKQSYTFLDSNKKKEQENTDCFNSLFLINLLNVYSMIIDC